MLFGELLERVTTRHADCNHRYHHGWGIPRVSAYRTHQYAMHGLGLDLDIFFV